MDIEKVRLRPVGLPVGGGGGGQEGRDTTARFVRADGPGGERGDFAKIIGERHGGGGCGSLSD